MQVFPLQANLGEWLAVSISDREFPGVKPLLRVETSFQDTPARVFSFVLYYKGRPPGEQLDELGLEDGDKVILWEQDCDDYEMEATLLFDYDHPMMFKRALWARVENSV